MKQFPYIKFANFLGEKVKDLLETQPHSRLGIANVEKKGEWEFEQFLNAFRREFDKMAVDW